MAKRKDPTRGQMITRASQCFPDRLHRTAAINLIESEYPYVAGPCVATPAELLIAYGIMDASGKITKYGMGYEGLDKRDTPTQIVCKLLRYNRSWGEFIGGVIASFPSFDPWERLMIRKDLEMAVIEASQSGVDH